jgi:hypothetical protein
VSAFAGPDWVIHFGIAFLGFAILNAAANLYTAVRSQTFQWHRTKSSRADKPWQYVFFVLAMVAIIPVYGWIALFLMRQIG